MHRILYRKTLQKYKERKKSVKHTAREKICRENSLLANLHSRANKYWSQVNRCTFGSFRSTDHQTKCLLNVESNGGEIQASSRGKSSKCLQFDPINTTCTSNATANSNISTTISQEGRYTPARFPIGSNGVLI